MTTILLSLIAGLLFAIATRLFTGDVENDLDYVFSSFLNVIVISLFLAGVIYGVAFGLNILAKDKGVQTRSILDENTTSTPQGGTSSDTITVGGETFTIPFPLPSK